MERRVAERLLENYRHHFTRMWANRHNPHTRHAIRDNIRGQRGVHRKSQP